MPICVIGCTVAAIAFAYDHGLMQNKNDRTARRVFARCVCLAVLGSALTTAQVAFAEKEPGARLLDEQRDKARQEALDRAPPAPDTSSTRPALDADPRQVAETGPTIESAVITVDAAGLLSPESVEATLARYLSLPLGERRIELLLRQFDALLVEAGYVTSHANLKRLSIETRRVDIVVLPGRIKSIRARGEAVRTALARAFPLAPGDVLRLAEVEQGIHQINRLRLYQAQINIQPGQSPATSVLDLVLDTGKPWHASFGADNQGSPATGRGRLRAGLAIDDALGMLDALQLVGLASSDSRAAFASLALPQGFNTWSLTGSASLGKQRLPGDLQLRSTSWTAVAGWNRVLALAAEGRDSADVTLSRSRSARRIEGEALAPDHLAVLRVAINHLSRGPVGQWYIEPAVSAGLPILGAKRDPSDIERRDAHAQFVKLSIAAGGVAAVAGGPTDLSVQLTGQVSHDSLYGSEQISLGGMSTVRGFQEGVLAGDSGYLMRTELRLPRSLDMTFAGGRPVPYVHFDHGATWLVQAPRKHLNGAGIGLRWAGSGVVAEAVASRAISAPNALRDGWLLHFSLGIEI